MFANISGYSVGIGLLGAYDSLGSWAYGAGAHARIGILLQRSLVTVALLTVPVRFQGHRRSCCAAVARGHVTLSPLSSAAQVVVLWAHIESVLVAFKVRCGITPRPVLRVVVSSRAPPSQWCACGCMCVCAATARHREAER
jgi:hypothetical protein